MSNTTKILILILIATSLFVGGYAVGKYCKELSPLNSVPEIINSQNNDNFQAGWDSAETRLKESGFFMEPEEVKEINGEVISITGDKIELKISPLFPLADSDLDTRNVIVNAQTAIYLLKQKDLNAYEAEMKAYDLKINQLMQSEEPNLTEISNPPEFFERNKVTVADIQKNQIIRVITETNIKDSKEFIAKEILIESIPENIISENILESNLTGTGETN